MNSIKIYLWMLCLLPLCSFNSEQIKSLATPISGDYMLRNMIYSVDKNKIKDIILLFKGTNNQYFSYQLDLTKGQLAWENKITTNASAMQVDDNKLIVGIIPSAGNKSQVVIQQQQGRLQLIADYKNGFNAHNTLIDSIYADDKYIVTQSTAPTIRFWSKTNRQSIKEIRNAFLLGYKDGTAVWAKKSFTGLMLNIYVGFIFDEHVSNITKKKNHDFKHTKELFSIPFIDLTLPLLPACYIEKDKILVNKDRRKSLIEAKYDEKARIKHIDTKELFILSEGTRKKHTQKNVKNTLVERELINRTPFKIEWINGTSVLLVYDDCIVSFNPQATEGPQAVLHTIVLEEKIVSSFKDDNDIYFVTYKIRPKKKDITYTLYKRSVSLSQEAQKAGQSILTSSKRIESLVSPRSKKK